MSEIDAADLALKQETIRLEDEVGPGLSETSPPRSRRSKRRNFTCCLDFFDFENRPRIFMCGLEQRLREARSVLEKKATGRESRH